MRLRNVWGLEVAEDVADYIAIVYILRVKTGM